MDTAKALDSQVAAEAAFLDDRATEQILHVIEESLKVSRRFQFFLWARGALQGLIPHEALLCGCGDVVACQLKFDSFSSGEDSRSLIERVIEPASGLLTRIIRAWDESAREPLLLVADAEPADAAAIPCRECGNALAHGAREVSGGDGSFFLFLHMPVAPTPRQAYLLDLVMPHLHMALHRMLLWEKDPLAKRGGTVGGGDSVLSVREAEVLRWVGQGKTNEEIGRLLDISPRTVKNHVQNILRKLGVSNRAQAVSKGHAAHLIGSEFHWQCDNQN